MKYLNTALPVIAALGTGLWLASASAEEAAPSAALTKADVEKIVHDYIMAHPDDILTAVDDFQRTRIEEQRKQGVAQNEFGLFKEKAPEIGNPKGDVTIVEFFDYNCGYCKRALPNVTGLLDGDKNIRFIFKDFPILGPTSELAAKWALASEKQGKYFEFHKALMELHGAIDENTMAETAKTVGLDVEQLKKDALGSDIAEKISKNRALAASIGLTGTPAFVVGSQVAPGAIGIEQMKSMIAEERAKTK